MASTIEAASPWWASSDAAWLSSAASHPGSPLAMPPILPLSPWDVRLLGISAK